MKLKEALEKIGQMDTEISALVEEAEHLRNQIDARDATILDLVERSAEGPSSALPKSEAQASNVGGFAPQASNITKLIEMANRGSNRACQEASGALLDLLTTKDQAFIAGQLVSHAMASSLIAILKELVEGDVISSANAQAQTSPNPTKK